MCSEVSSSVPHFLKSQCPLGPEKGTQINYPFPSKSPSKRIPSGFPSRAPMGRNSHLQGIYYGSLNISVFIFPSESPVREPPPCSLTGSPWTGILRHQSHLSIHSCMSAGVPKKEPSYIHMGKNIRSPSTEPYAIRRPTYSGVRPSSPRITQMYRNHVSTETSKLHEKKFVFIPFLLNIMYILHTDVSCSTGIFYVNMLCMAKNLFYNKLYVKKKTGCKQ